MRIYWSLLVVVAVVSGARDLVAGNLEPLEPPGPTMKTLTVIEPRQPVHTLGPSATAVYRIDQPGSYYFAHNVYGVNAKNGIEITVDNVTLDMMGFSLVGVPGSLDGITEEPSIFLKGLTVRNGSIRDWGENGINFQTTDDVLIEEVVVSGCGDWGLLVDGGIGMVKDSQFIDNSIGVDLLGGTIIRCVARRNSASGVRIGNEHGVVREVVSVNNGSGLNQGAGGGWVIEDSTFSDNDGHGINACSDNIIRNNTIITNGRDSASGAGIHLRCGSNLVEGNLVVGNDIGISALASGGEVVIRNFLDDNTTAVDPSTGNDFAPLQQAATSTNPWANISN